MHNESLKDQVVDGTVSDNGSTPSKSSPGLAIDVKISTKYLYAGAALVAGLVIGRKLTSAKELLRTGAVESASKIQDVAEQAEEAAARR
jgi:hypothetical protein